jgi:hypothetical protein
MKKLIPIFILFLISCKKEIFVDNQSINSVKSNFVFNGYKVDTILAKQLGTEYWVNIGVPEDLISDIFQKGVFPSGGNIYRQVGFCTGLVSGDFNKDGWVDVFNPGATNIPSPDNPNGLYSYLSFLLWDTTTKTFKDTNLFNVKSFNHIGANTIKSIPIDLNKDGYVDLILIDNSEGYPTGVIQPVRLVVSDGKGGYDIHELKTETPSFTKSGGSVGDLDGDKIPDLILNYGGMMKIFKGLKTKPYFSMDSVKTFAMDVLNLEGGAIVKYENNNGFGDLCGECVSDYTFMSTIADVNKDGWNDIILCGGIDNRSPNRILYNQDSGRFNKNSIVYLPLNGAHNEDYIVEDINGDGKNDLISVNSSSPKWNMVAYINQGDYKSFKIDESIFQYTINSTRHSNWKPKLIFHDFNGDGKKDITYIDETLDRWDDPNNSLKYKSIFERNGNSYKEISYYERDSYSDSLRIKYFK